MMNRTMFIGSLIFVSMFATDVVAQKSSIGSKARLEQANRKAKNLTRELPSQPSNAVYLQHSWISEPPPKPKTFSPGDLLTVIIRERRKWKADADLETKKEFDLTSEIAAFFKLTGGGVGASPLRRGKPKLDLTMEQEFKGEGDASRKDSLTTRLTTKIIDVKPNGLLVFEGRAKITHDDEVSIITITGTCRKEDVTADNTVLSTQVADKEIKIDNQGALRAVSSRGWIPKILDLIKPF